MAVGTQAVGQDVGVALISLVASQPIARAQRFDGSTGDPHDLKLGFQQCLDDGPIGTLDGDPSHMLALELTHEARETSRALTPSAMRDGVTGGVDATRGG